MFQLLESLSHIDQEKMKDSQIMEQSESSRLQKSRIGGNQSQEEGGERKAQKKGKLDGKSVGRNSG